MDCKLWKAVYQMVMSVAHAHPRAGVTHSDQVIVLVALRAASDDQAVSWACREENWMGLERSFGLPSQATMSRRLRTPEVQRLLDEAEARLRNLDPAAAGEPLVVDGRPLVVNPYSKDRDARWGYAITGYARGYKVTAIWGSGALPLAWDVRPMNAAESVVARRRLVPRLPRPAHERHLVGDAAYDSNPLYAVAAAQGYQLLAPPKKPGRGWGHRRHHPARRKCRELLATPEGRALYSQRSSIERKFGNWAVRAEGLSQLPPHVRRTPRVRLFVHAKLLLNATRILINHSVLPLTAT